MTTIKPATVYVAERTAVDALATTLIQLAADYLAAERPIDTKLAKATLKGACRAAHAAGFGKGVTPDGIFLVALDYARASTRPPAGAAFPAAYRAWVDNGVAVVGPAL